MSEFEELQAVPELLPIYLEQGPEGVLSAILPDIGRPWTSTEKRMFETDGTMPNLVNIRDLPYRPPNPGTGVKF